MRKRKIGFGVLGIVMAVLAIVILWFMIKIPIRIVKEAKRYLFRLYKGWSLRLLLGADKTEIEPGGI